MPPTSPPGQRLNYDDIAHLYDEPGRDHVVDPNLIAFLEARGEIAGPIVHVLDVGCGTGKQLAADRDRWPDIVLVGLDRFGAMLRIARGKCSTVAWLQADGTDLPFASARFHYATNQFSYPHIRNTRKLLSELFRILRPGGRFVMTNIDPWSMPGWLVYRYFPEALELDHQDFLPVDGFVALMQEVGFQDVHGRRTDVSRVENLRDFLAYASARHRTSQLMAIAGEAYEAGLGRLARAVAEAHGEELRVKSDLVLVTIAGDKPE